MALSGPSAWTLYVDDARNAVGARSHFVEFLRSIESEDGFIDTAELIFGELLGNVVRHAPGPVEIAVDLHEDAMVLHVTDSGPVLGPIARPLPADVLSERGRGLFIVGQLASEVRVEYVGEHGNHISVKMLRRPA
jgi:anti-sigma regulatory factor (Ser/Thr protein kinase)